MKILMWLTFTRTSISTVSSHTGTCEATNSVGAGGCRTTICVVCFTLVDIYVTTNQDTMKQLNWREACPVCSAKNSNILLLRVIWCHTKWICIKLVRYLISSLSRIEISYWSMLIIKLVIRAHNIHSIVRFTLVKMEWNSSTEITRVGYRTSCKKINH